MASLISLRGGSRVLAWLCVSALLVFIFAYHRSSTRIESPSPLHSADSNTYSAPTKLLVVATDKKRQADTDWVHELPDWPHRIYVAGDASAPFHTETNKGNEANHYLTYILSDYDSLPDIVVFTHHHNTAPHVDVSLKTNVNAIRRLILTHVLSTGYQSLRCEREKHCTLKTIDYWNQVNEHYREAWNYAFDPEPCPEVVVAPCCSQFAVSKQVIRSRPRDQYLRLHEWLMTTDGKTMWTGRVLEYMWHILFGKPAVFCAEQNRCYCEAFGLCEPGSDLGWNPDLANEYKDIFFNETINE